MRRVITALFVLTMVAAVAPAAVSAATTDRCRSLSSDFRPVRINLTWQSGQPFPGAGDEWWAQTVAGFAAEGLSVADAAALFDTTPAGLYELIVTGIRGLDKNGNGIVCSKGHPEQQNGAPAYVFNAVDDQKK